MENITDLLVGLTLEQYDLLQTTLERELLDPLPAERDLYIPTDPQTYVHSVASDVLPALASYYSTLALPSTSMIDFKEYKAYNVNVPRVDLVLEAVILIMKDDKARSDFRWDEARRACDQLSIAYPSTEEEAENLATDLIESLRKAVEVRGCGTQVMVTS